MRKNDRAVIKMGPARYDSDKATRSQIEDAKEEAKIEAYDAIVNNPNLNLAGGGGGGATPTPGTFPIYSAPSLATNYPVDGLSLTSKIYSDWRPYLTAIDTVGGAGLGANCIFGQQMDGAPATPTFSSYRGFNVSTGTTTVLPAGGDPDTKAGASGIASPAVFSHGDYIYSYGFRWSLATGWQSFQSDDTYGATAKADADEIEVVGISNGYVWIAYVGSFSGSNYGIWAVDKSGNVTKAYTLPSNTSVRGAKVENGTIWMTTINSGGTRTTMSSAAVLPLSFTTITMPSADAHLTNKSHQDRAIDTSGNMYYIDRNSNICRLNVISLGGTNTQYPNLFSTTGDPLDGEPANRYVYSTSVFLSEPADDNSSFFTPQWLSVIYGRIFVGCGLAGDFLGATYPDRVYPAIYEVALSGGSSSASVFHASLDPSYPAPPSLYDDNQNYGFTMGPFLLDGGDITWSDNAWLVQTRTGNPTLYINDLSQIYRATI
jgi:hypothetical protein